MMEMEIIMSLQIVPPTTSCCLSESQTRAKFGQISRQQHLHLVPVSTSTENLSATTTCHERVSF